MMAALIAGLPVAAQAQEPAVMSVPYTETFDSLGAFNTFTVVDVNNDGKTWEYFSSGKYARSNYNNRIAADDWLLTPEIHLEAGRFYTITFDAKNETSYNQERIEAGLGSGTDPLGYDIIFPKRVLTGNTFETFNIETSVPVTGDYRVGFHDCSDADEYRLSVDNISVTEGASFDAPAAVTGLKATAGARGELTANISFTTPTLTAGNGNLNELSKIEVYRNDSTLVGTVENPAVGAEVTVTDTLDAKGEYSYSAYAYNAVGKGLRAATSVFVGEDTPAEMQNVQLHDVNGELQLTWDPIKGKHGGYLNPDSISYTVYYYNQYGIGAPTITGITDTIFRPDTTTTGEQFLLRYGVAANTATGKTDYVSSNLIPVGTAYSLPFRESFAGGNTSTGLWWRDKIGYTSFRIITSESYDNDGGALRYTGMNNESQAWFNTGNISLEGTQNPVLLFAYKTVPGKNLKFYVEAEMETFGTDTLEFIDYASQTGEAEWKVDTVSLASLREARYVMLKFHAVSNDYNNDMDFDDIRIIDLVDNNLMASIDGPKRIVAGKKSTFNVKVDNIGANKANGFTIDLYVNNELAKSVDGGEIAQLADSTYTIDYDVPVSKFDSIDVYAVANFSSDDIPSDNNTDTLHLKVYPSDFATVDDLTAEVATDGSVALNWTAPQLNQGEYFTDDFEDYEPWTIYGYGDWTSYDHDSSPNGPIGGMSFPHESDAYAYMVFAPEQAGIDSTSSSWELFQPHSGRQYLAAFSASQYYAESSDDWLVSPQLSGVAQTLSFYAKSVTVSYPETFQVLYSTTRNEMSDFIPIDTVTDAASQWTLYTDSLPEGTKYFAIRHVSAGKIALLIDDITYKKGGIIGDIAGYNIYRDGELIATTDSAVTTFTDTEAEKGSKHVYNVTVAYTTGESAYSNDAEVMVADGIQSVGFAPDANVTIFNLSGIKVYEGNASSMAVPRGIYIVKAGGTTRKIAIR